MLMFKNLSYLPLNLLWNRREEKWGKGAWATQNTSGHKAPSHPAAHYAWCVTDSRSADGISGMGKSLQAALLHYRIENWSCRSANITTDLQRQGTFLHWRQHNWSEWTKVPGWNTPNNWPVCHSGLRLCPYTLCMWICSSSLSSGSSEQTSSDQGDECFLPGGTFPDDPTQKAKHTCRQKGAS